MVDDNNQEGKIKIEIEDVEKELDSVEGAAAAEVFDAEDAQVTTEEEMSTEEMLDPLQSELEETRSKADEYLDGWQRSRAEFANYKKRVERDQAQIYQNIAGNLTKRYLEIADDLERALNSRPEDGEGAQWANGIELIYRKLMSTIEAEGVERIVPDGHFFDPNFHEAISQEDSPEHESGQIIEVLQPGYKLGDRILRPARVRVAR